ncbi:hypothetical protein Kisp01_69790 [Kineosporia sp. NBRC 101677]|nr:hypothetical protein Kisp01_69790 [Kineosporia sp. NBRC 101677]
MSTSSITHRTRLIPNDRNVVIAEPAFEQLAASISARASCRAWAVPTTDPPATVEWLNPSTVAVIASECPRLRGALKAL